MKILLTGAFGNVGSSTLKELVKRDHFIRCFDIPNKRNKKKARKFQRFKDKVEIYWGDLRNPDDVENAVSGMEIVIHLGAIIPPLANERPELAEPVNVGGTKNIISAIKKQSPQPKLVFSSSVAVFGDVRDKGCNHIIQIDDEFNPSPHDEYARMKIKCEKMIKDSDIEWAIFRFAAIPPVDLKVDPIMFDVPLDTPIEFCHTHDTGLAMANTVGNQEIWGRIFNIAGGPACRVPYHEYVGRLLDSLGIGRLPEEAFGDEPFHCGYMDTTESQRILNYQQHTFDDLVNETKKRLGIARIFTIILRPTIRWLLLKKSSYYQAYMKSIKQYLKGQTKLPRTKSKTTSENSEKTKKKTVKPKPRKTGS
ncbi:MAG: NAD(P)-dependent oxidoreductase [Asgard group archaeon]|nr:NAD(P)-dependent oxidoreductase [Asgard group archaeon]